MELGVRVGDTVYYGKYTGTDVEVDGQKFVILRETRHPRRAGIRFDQCEMR